MALPELAGWQAESLRVTFIANEPVAAAGKNWWQAATGSPPDTIVSKQNISEHSESGAFGNGQLEMKVMFNRVDWLYTPTASPGDALSTLGCAKDVFDALKAPMAAWLHVSDTPYVRIAYCPTVLRPVEDLVGGYRMVASYLPFLQIDPEVAKDVFFQINFPCKSNILDEMTINRLNRFMCATAQIINMGPGQLVPLIQTQHYCRAELDFNTDAERSTPIPSDICVDLISELVDFCREVMNNGVHP